MAPDLVTRFITIVDGHHWPSVMASISQKHINYIYLGD